MDVVEKCRRFHDDPAYAERIGYPTDPRTAQAHGLYPYFVPLDESDGTTAVIAGQRRIMIGSNSYLGLMTDPRVRQAAPDAVHRYGTRCTGSRFLNGTLSLHLGLEEGLAWYVGEETALVFGTGYQANLGVISALVGRRDVVVCDKEDHASIFEGCRLSGGELRRFRHNDVANLDRVLSTFPLSAGRLVVVDGVFSTSGEIGHSRRSRTAAGATGRGSWWMMPMGSGSQARGGAPRPTTGSRRRWTSSLWPQGAGSSPVTRRRSTGFSTGHGRSSSARASPPSERGGRPRCARHPRARARAGGEGEGDWGSNEGSAAERRVGYREGGRR